MSRKEEFMIKQEWVGMNKDKQVLVVMDLVDFKVGSQALINFMSNSEEHKVVELKEVKVLHLGVYLRNLINFSQEVEEIQEEKVNNNKKVKI